MSYSKDLREGVLAYTAAGNSIEKTSAVFKAGTATIKAWKKLVSETGSLEKKESAGKPRKFESEKLRAYVKENPEATLAEIAKEFDGSPSGAFDALEREKITLKKQQQRIAGVMKKNERSTTPKQPICLMVRLWCMLMKAESNAAIYVNEHVRREVSV
jgi:transposase